MFSLGETMSSYHKKMPSLNGRIYLLPTFFKRNNLTNSKGQYFLKRTYLLPLTEKLDLPLTERQYLRKKRQFTLYQKAMSSLGGTICLTKYLILDKLPYTKWQSLL